MQVQCQYAIKKKFIKIELKTHWFFEPFTGLIDCKNPCQWWNELFWKEIFTRSSNAMPRTVICNNITT